MPTIKNKTGKPLIVSLPGGKKLRLGPFKSAEIPPKAVDRPQVQKLIEAEEVEISELQRLRQGSGGNNDSRRSSGRQGRGSGIRQSGDR